MQLSDKITEYYFWNPVVAHQNSPFANLLGHPISHILGYDASILERYILENMARKVIKAINHQFQFFLKNLIIEFNDPLPIMFATIFPPSQTPKGVQISNSLDNLVVMTTFASNNKYYICISWENVINATGEILANSIRRLPNDEIATACLQLAMYNRDNVYFRPSWFNSLGQRQKDKLTALTSIQPIMGVQSDQKIDMNVLYPLPEAKTSYFC